MNQKYSKIAERLSSVAVFLGKVESEKKSSVQERDRLIHRIQQLELELRNNMEAGTELINQNTEYRTFFVNSSKNGSIRRAHEPD